MSGIMSSPRLYQVIYHLGYVIHNTRLEEGAVTWVLAVALVGTWSEMLS